MAIDKNRDLAVTSSVLLLVLLWRTEAVPTAMNADLSKNTELGTAIPSSRSSNCSLLTFYLDIIELDSKIRSGYPLVEIELRILNYSADFLKQRLTRFFQPNCWVRSQGQTGISLLVWESRNWKLFDPYLKIGVDHITVKLADFPPGCLKSLNAENTAFIIRKFLLNDFNIEKVNSTGVQKKGVQVCNQIVKETNQSAMFVYHCCEKNINGDVICEEAKANSWLDKLDILRIPIIVVVYLYSPALLFYLLDFEKPTTYLCEILEPDRSKTPLKPAPRQIPFLYTNNPSYQFTTMEKMCNTKVKGEERFKRLPALICNAVYEGTSNRPQLIVKSRRLLTQNEIPVGMYRMLYNLFTGRFRHIEIFERDDFPFIDKCNTILCRFLQMLLKAFILLILSVPNITMFINFYKYRPQFEEKERIVKEINSTVAIQNELIFLVVNTTLLAPFYLLYLADMFSIGFVWKCIRPKFKETFQWCTDKNSKYEYLFRLLYKIPCFRLYIEIFANIIACICGIGQGLFQWNLCLFILFLISVYIDFVIWVIFIVNFFFYTIIGIIIYTEYTMKILTGIALLLTYGRTTFNKVWQDYMQYHSRVFKKLIKTAKSRRKKFRLNRQRCCGATPTNRQENNQEVRNATPEEEETLANILPLTNLTTKATSKKGQAMLHIKGMFLVVDTYGQNFMPMEFFYKAIKIDSCLAPGPDRSRYLHAFIRYIKIIIFLAFIYIVVMAFGDTYKGSLTYELLATVITSLFPLIFDVIKSDDTSAKQNDEGFEEKLSAKFDEYEEDFPISDFVSSRLVDQRLSAGTNADVDLIIINTTQHVDRNTERQHLEESEV